MNIINSLEWRYAIKKFDSAKKLSNQQIETLKKAFNLTPTSFGLQPIKMIVIENKELQEKFVELSYFQRQVADASHLLIICIKNDTTAEDINSYFNLEKETRNIEESAISNFRKQLLEMYKNKTIEDIVNKNKETNTYPDEFEIYDFYTGFPDITNVLANLTSAFEENQTSTRALFCSNIPSLSDDEIP